MSAARPILRNQTYMLTRRASERRFFLRPDRIVKVVTLYILAVAAARFDITIHAYCFMSNHWHVLFTDPHRNAPKFYEFIHRNIAQALNIHLGRKENFWEKPAQTYLEAKYTPGSVLAAAVYIVANPVKAGLVRFARLWQGGISHMAPFDGDHSQMVKRPGFYFNADNPNWPDEVELRLVKPPGFEELTEEEFHDKVREKVGEVEEAKQEEMDRTGQKFLGPKRVRALNPFARSTAPTKKKHHRRRQPTERDDWLKEWQDLYRQARKNLLQGVKAIFPLGTYWLERFIGVEVASTPRPPPPLLNPDVG